jgi:hypothetical protein
MVVANARFGSKADRYNAATGEADVDLSGIAEFAVG